MLLVLDPTSYKIPSVNTVNDESVVYENKLQLYNATRFVISSNDDFSMARKLQEEDETLRQEMDRVILRKVKIGERSFIQMSNVMKFPLPESKG